MFLTRFPRLLSNRSQFSNAHRFISYVQGQVANDKREYFYYIDHQGQLFLDDAKMKNFTSCFKEKQFLAFFFKRLKVNNTGTYEEEFPYISPCGKEMNYIRCDDRPIVFTKILESTDDDVDELSICDTGNLLTVDFEPEKICMLPDTGRIYHPCPGKFGKIGLIKSSIAIDISKFFEFSHGKEHEPPTHFKWKGKKYELSNEIAKELTKEKTESYEATPNQM